MKRWLVICCICAVFGSLALAQSSFQSFDKFINSREDVRDRDRSIRRACYRIQRLQVISNETRRVFYGRTAEDLLLLLQRVALRAQEIPTVLEIANDGRNLDNVLFSPVPDLAISAVTEKELNSAGVVSDAMIVLLGEIADLSRSIANQEADFEQIGVLFDQVDALNQACSYLLGLDVGLS